MFNRHFFAARRMALGLTVEELANEILVAPSTVYRWESGETCPSLRMLVIASRHLCTPILSLIMKRTARGAGRLRSSPNCCMRMPRPSNAR
ncbi:helix-turn-helix domain-containing protein [Streptomyces gibsoniae]|uniref:helix-turn-helix domain-containing protein n=1 Tax=Streptomyces gibsoniae TaxID=3075529 RepID=UPI00374E0AAF